MIDREQVLHVAKLARLKLTEEEIGSFTRQIGSILEYIEKLDQAPTERIEPTCFVEPDYDPLRDDIQKDSLSSEEALQNAPKAKKGHFSIPKVIG